MYELDIDAVKDLPGCRTHFQIKDTSTGMVSYCALGKLLKAAGLPNPEEGDPFCYQTAQFLTDIDSKYYEWVSEIYDLNDSKEGDFKENHALAFEKAVDKALLSGKCKVKQSCRQLALV